MDKDFLKLEEGNFYDFAVAGKVILPDGDEWIKLTDPNGYKHLLNAAQYRYYNLKSGQIVKCRVDHINCTGKLYIEPTHPNYQIGGIYNFEVIGRNTINNKFGEQEDIVVLKDCFGNKIQTPVISSTDHQEFVNARVIRIKKGKIYVTLNTDPDTFDDIPHNKFHSFKISGYQTISAKYEYFILTDEKGRTYYLRSKYYQKYDLKPGELIDCRLIREESGFFFEPIHPFYKIGHEYPFTIISKTKIAKYPDDEIPALELLNEYGRNILLPLNEQVNENIQGEKIFCTVKDIRRSNLILYCNKKAFSS